MNKIKGFISAPFTPFAADGALQLAAVPGYAEFLKAQGVAGVFVGGTTGEGESLTAEERMQLAEAWVAQKNDTFKVIVHAGMASAVQGGRLARHAQEIGADAAGAIYLHHHAPRSVQELVSHCEEIAAGCPKLPFYYYHMPAQTGVSFKASEILRASARAIPNLVGCKFTFEDLMDYQLCLDLEDGRFDILFGRDEMLLPSLSIGAEGWIGSTFNFAGRLHHSILAAFERGDLKLARLHQQQVNDVIQIFAARGFLRTAKAAMSLYGVDLGPTRAPLEPLSEAELAQVGKLLDGYALGIERTESLAA